MSPTTAKEGVLRSRAKTLLLLLLPVSAAMGGYLLPLNIGPGDFYGFRYLVLILIALAGFRFLSSRDGTIRFSKTQRRFLGLMAVWVVWGFVGTTWAPDKMAALKEVACLIFGAGLVLSCSVLYTPSESHIKHIRLGWILALVSVAGIAVWEIQTGQHLHGSWVDDYDAYEGIVVCVSTFGNPNNYAAFILLGSPAMLWMITSHRSRWAKGFMILFYIAQMVLLLCTGSRLALAGELVVLVAFFGFSWAGWRRWVWIPVLIVITLSVFPSMLSRFQNQSTFFIVNKLETSGTTILDSSGIERVNLQRDGLWMIEKSYGLGVGPAGFSTSMKSAAVPHPLAIFSPHDFAIEIASQYGLVIFLIFAWWVAKLVIDHYRARSKILAQASRVEADRTDHLALLNTHLAGFFGFLFAIFCNSGFLVQPSTWWLFLAWVQIGSYAESLSKEHPAMDATPRSSPPGNSWRQVRL